MKLPLDPSHFDVPLSLATCILGAAVSALGIVAATVADLLAMAGDDTLMAAGLKAMRASPEKKSAAIAAFDQALASAPSR